MTKEQRFAQYCCEQDTVLEIARLVREDQVQSACNRLAKHVRQNAEISANAEYGILLVEQAFIRGRAHDAEIKEQIERIKTWCRMHKVPEAVGGAEPAGERQSPADGAPEPSPAGTNVCMSHGGQK